MTEKENLQKDTANLDELKNELPDSDENEGKQTKLPKGITLATAGIAAMAMTACSDSDNEQNEPPDEEPEENPEEENVGPLLETIHCFEGKMRFDLYGKNNEDGTITYKILAHISEELWQTIEHGTHNGVVRIEFRMNNFGLVGTVVKRNDPSYQPSYTKDGNPEIYGGNVRYGGNGATGIAYFIFTQRPFDINVENLTEANGDVIIPTRYICPSNMDITEGQERPVYHNMPRGNGNTGTSTPQEFQNLKRGNRRVGRKSM